jgi:hypothetical protein
MSIIVKTKISDQTVKTFNAVLAMARKTSELDLAFAVTFMPAMVDCRKWATARSSTDDLGQFNLDALIRSSELIRHEWLTGCCNESGTLRMAFLTCYWATLASAETGNPNTRSAPEIDDRPYHARWAILSFPCRKSLANSRQAAMKHFKSGDEAFLR